MARAACMARTQLCMHACMHERGMVCGRQVLLLPWALHINATSVSGRTGFANSSVSLATLPSLVINYLKGQRSVPHKQAGLETVPGLRLQKLIGDHAMLDLQHDISHAGLLFGMSIEMKQTKLFYDVGRPGDSLHESSPASIDRERHSTKLLTPEYHH
eukprot:1120223-Pelagomonas_calceolata.AAC.5